MHFFPLFQCDYFIALANINTGSIEDSEKLIDELVQQIETIQCDIRPKVTSQKFDDIREIASKMIPDDVNKLSELPLDRLVAQYLELKPKLESMEPQVIKMHK